MHQFAGNLSRRQPRLLAVIFFVFLGFFIPGRGAAKKPLPAAGERTGEAILLRTGDGLSKLGNEGYQLSAFKNGVRIEAAAPPGLFYGIQTLLQLLPAGAGGGGKGEGGSWSCL